MEKTKSHVPNHQPGQDIRNTSAQTPNSDVIQVALAGVEGYLDEELAVEVSAQNLHSTNGIANVTMSRYMGFMGPLVSEHHQISLQVMAIVTAIHARLWPYGHPLSPSHSPIIRPFNPEFFSQPW